MDDGAILNALLAGRLRDPFAVLGRHREGEQAVWRCFLPEVEAVEIVTRSGVRLVALERRDAAGYFVGRTADDIAANEAYFLRAYRQSSAIDLEDPYRFGPVLGELDVHLLAEGTHLQAYEKLGGHPISRDGVAGVGFAVWAPNALSVSVIGDFNDWDGRRHPMRFHPVCGVWDLFVPQLAPGARYKFQLHAHDGRLLPLKADPCALAAEAPPGTASVVAGAGTHLWRDADWLAGRGARQSADAAIAIYEVHLGSWRRRWSDGRYFSWAELAAELVPYVAELGFTHIEMLPVSEYPFDGSWGYQPIGLMAPTGRFGDADGFRAFVDACHAAEIGVLVDFVPAHFPTDIHGLAQFDGTALYEHADPRQGFHQDWNTLIFNFGRREVANYLIAAALSWLDRFHVDGLRVDAVASMLYLDYSRAPGAWIPNEQGGRENWDAVRFLQRFNQAITDRFDGVVTTAEESTAWPGVTRPVAEGGLGFGFKWNMGWMHDTLRYFGRDPIYRRHHQHDLTFGLVYAFSEKFILPLSHDEVVHGKGSLRTKMPGTPTQALANLRAYFGFMWAHPGKKLLFMGGEFAQQREWNHDFALDWTLLADPGHRGVQALVRDLNGLYRAEKALHERDAEPEGFDWIDIDDADRNVVSFVRYGRDAGNCALVVCNFSGASHFGYRVGAPFAGRWEECVNTDAAEYGGSGLGNLGGASTQPVPWQGRAQSLELTLPASATLVFAFRG